MHPGYELTVNRQCLVLVVLCCCGLFGDPTFEAGAAQHTVRPVTVERTPGHPGQAGTHTPQPAELRTTLWTVHWTGLGGTALRETLEGTDNREEIDHQKICVRIMCVCVYNLSPTCAVSSAIRALSTLSVVMCVLSCPW